jgi:hypothetical protein
MCGPISHFPPHAFMARYVVKHGDNFMKLLNFLFLNSSSNLWCIHVKMLRQSPSRFCRTVEEHPAVEMRRARSEDRHTSSCPSLPRCGEPFYWTFWRSWSVERDKQVLRNECKPSHRNTEPLHANANEISYKLHVTLEEVSEV